jgi:peroxiredoxin
MAKTFSNMPALGSQAPHFRLPEPDGKIHSLEDFQNKKVLLVMFLCNHCPFVKHIRSGISKLARDYAQKEVAIIAISSNDPIAYPADSPEKMIEEKREAGYVFPYLFDEKQSVAKAYQAACTPDFFVYDSHRELIYRGQFDDSRPSNREPITGADLRRALDLALINSVIPEKEQVASLGCNIKWRQDS